MASPSKQSSSSKQQHPPLAIHNTKLRPRANTEEYLGKDYIPVPNEIPPPLQPGRNPEDYSEARVKQGLQYADCVLRNPQRKLSPVGTAAIMLYKEACKKFLALLLSDDGLLEEDGRKNNMLQNEYVATLRGFERDISLSACMHITQNSDVAAFQKELLELRRMSYYARYGDFYRDACKDLQEIAQAKEVDNWQTLTGKRWSEISKQLQEEKPIWDKLCQGIYVDPASIPANFTHEAVKLASLYTTFDFAANLELIHQYTERNRIFHAGLFEYIKAGQMAALAKKLSDDLCDISAVFNHGDKFSQTLLRSLINSVIDCWYTRDDKEPDDYNYWVPKPVLIQLRKDLQQKSQDQVKREKEAQSQLFKAWKQREKMRLQELEFKKDVSQLGQISGYSKIRKISATSWDEEYGRNEKRRKVWTCIMDRVRGIRKSSAEYVEEYGEFETPPKLTREK